MDSSKKEMGQYVVTIVDREIMSWDLSIFAMVVMIVLFGTIYGLTSHANNKTKLFIYLGGILALQLLLIGFLIWVLVPMLRGLFCR